MNMKNKQKRSHIGTCVSLLAVFVAMVINPSQVQGQMFSVGDNAERVVRPTLNSVMVGVAPTQFRFQGGNQTEVLRLDFDDVLLRAVLETPTLNVYMSYGANLGANDAISAFNLGAVVSNRVPLNRGNRSQVYLPLRLITDWRTARNTQTGTSNDEFQQSSVMVGTGIGTIVRLTGKSAVDLSANGNYGYAVRSFGADGGQTLQLEGKARYLVNNITHSLGLSFGYDYSWQEYYIGGNQFDYRLGGHSLFVGLRF